MERRKFINFGMGAAVTTLVAACGGGSDHRDDEVDVDTSVVLEPGVDPASLRSIPSPVDMDMAYLQQAIAATLRASVALGSVKQAGIAVDFYDASHQLLASAVTDIDGIAEADVQARRLVFAQARTAEGVLRGIHFYSGLELVPEVGIDILQTVFSDVMLRLVQDRNHYNIGMYVLQDYFRVPHDTNMLDIGHQFDLIDQRLVYADFQKSGLGLESYSRNLVNDIIDNINNDGYSNVKFNSHQGLGLQKRNELIQLVMDQVKNAITGAIPNPIVSKLVGFAFGKFFDWINPNPSEPDPFDTIYAELLIIEDKINSLIDKANEVALTTALRDTMANFNDFSVVMRDMVLLEEEQKKKVDGNRRDLYASGLLALSAEPSNGAPTSRAKILQARDMFVGCQGQRESSVMKHLLDVVQKPFYSRASEVKYRNYLEFYISYQAIAHLLLGASYIMRGQREGTPAQEISAKLVTLKNDFDYIASDISLLDVPSLPDRINIDHANKVAWVGTCGSIAELRHLWPASKKVTYKRVIDTHQICINGECKTHWEYEFTPWQGEGLEGWAGPDIKRHMLGSKSVTQEAFDFGSWRIPSLDEIRNSFYDEASRTRTKVDVYAKSAGFSAFSESQEIPAFNGPGSGLALVPARFRKAGGTILSRDEYLDLTTVDFSNNKIVGSAKATTIYDYGERRNVLTLLPVMTVSDALLDKYLPWRRFGQVSSQICK